MNIREKRNGFTLIEMLVVVVIIGLLAAFMVPKVGKKFGKAKRDIARAKMGLIENAMVSFQIDCGRYPYENEGLEALLEAPPELEEKWAGRYLKESELLDPWDNPYIYVEEGNYNVGSYDIVSLGADGEEGGDGDGEDIFNN